MSHLPTILSMAVGVFALRIGGLALAGARVPPAWERALGFVPVATLTALVVASLAGRPDEAPIRLLAAVAAGLAARRTGRAWVCIVVGMAVYGLLRLV
jgi:branched-subunit amino acid transport protein